MMKYHKQCNALFSRKNQKIGIAEEIIWMINQLSKDYK
ncbi:hypothetical protein BMS3Abin06_01867 [bacterium BMS3Abin06]|nr:hypothetical protein BMS3Abin06_01867 [bacterium BMS3Abin06]